MFIHKNQTLSVINLDRYCIYQDTYVCAIKLDILFRKLCTVTIYRFPSEEFKNFISYILYLTLHTFYHPKVILSHVAILILTI